jgi:large subunit ribosomal protein L7/L12
MTEEATVAEQTKEYSKKVKDVLDKLSGFTLMELSELVEAFEQEFGITASVAAAPVAVAGGGAAPAEVEEEAEPSSFKVVLKGFGTSKIQVIKAVRAETSLALKEAKAVVEGVPSTIKEGLTKEDAEKCVQVLEEAGGDAEMQPEAS